MSDWIEDVHALADGELTEPGVESRSQEGPHGSEVRRL